MTRQIANKLVNITVPMQEPIFAQDIDLAVNVISTLNNVTEAFTANLTANDTFFEDCASAIDNLLSSVNQDSWNQLERTSPSTSRTLVEGAEQIANLLSETLTNDTTEATKTRSNFVIKAEQISSDSLYEDFVFPDKSDNLSTYTGGIARLMITNDVLQNISSTTLTIAISVITNNISLRLTSSSEGTLPPQVPVSSILSLQINPPPDLSSLMENPIMLVFDVDSTATLSQQSSAQNDQDFVVDDMSCNFYDYTLITNNNLNQTGGWSTVGLEVDKSSSNRTLTTCLTRHLTSFAVLVSIQDDRPAEKALSLISYIGCYASLVCLCVSIVLLSYTIYKISDEKTHLFIHLNLCIVLALALVVFVVGVENASSNEYACKVTAALLQYLFISAFCWMLCEGVFLYMKLVTVFRNKLNNRYFFFILGWGPAIPIVAISVGIAYKQYGTNYYCWIKSDDGTIAAFIAPIVVIMLINAIFLAITLKVLWQHKTRNEEASSKRDTVKSLLKAMVILSPLLGMTWIIGIFAVNNETQVFAWIFAILNSLQGVFIFALNVIRNKQVAKEIRKCCRCARRKIGLVLVRGGAGINTSEVSSKGRTSHDQNNIYENFRRIDGSDVGTTSSDTLETSFN